MGDSCEAPTSRNRQFEFSLENNYYGMLRYSKPERPPVAQVLFLPMFEINLKLPKQPHRASKKPYPLPLHPYFLASQ